MSSTNAVYSPEWNGELRAFSAMLRDPARAQRTSAFVSGTNIHSGIRRTVEGKIGVYLQYFRRCAADEQRGFERDPLQIDRLVIELTDALTRIPPGGWPQLSRIKDEALALARETFPLRHRLWAADLTPLPPAQA